MPLPLSFATPALHRVSWFNAQPCDLDKANLYRMAGIIFGLAVLNGVSVEASFPLALYRLLLGQEPSFADLVSAASNLLAWLPITT